MVVKFEISVINNVDYASLWMVLYFALSTLFMLFNSAALSFNANNLAFSQHLED